MPRNSVGSALTICPFLELEAFAEPVKSDLKARGIVCCSAPYLKYSSWMVKPAALCTACCRGSVLWMSCLHLKMKALASLPCLKGSLGCIICRIIACFSALETGIEDTSPASWPQDCCNFLTPFSSFFTLLIELSSGTAAATIFNSSLD